MFDVEKTRSVLLADAYKKFENELVYSLINTLNNKRYVNKNNISKEKIEFLTSTFLGSNFYSEKDYLLALYGCICPNASFFDFEKAIIEEIPIIHNYYMANNGLDNFIGKWVVTRKSHQAYSRIEKNSIVKIIGVSERGYDIMDEAGNKVCEIGFTI